CHPTPIYELILGVIIFLILWRIRKNPVPDGKLFMFFLVFHGIARFLVEIIRINPRIIFNLSEAQLISLVLIVIGIIGIIYFTKNPDIPKFDPAKVNYVPKKKKES
ncbi:MAG: prolipoprotein diacylglyceryl transferase, partial [Ignavibacteria bacterium]|nr:prolipoprotein diacylglyceryl transferase [Ignavibacteria bacterium]